MKGLLKILFLGASGIIIVYGIRQVMLLYKSAYKVVKTKINNLSITGIDIILYLQLTNKSDISAQVVNQHYDIFLNDAKISVVDLKEEVHINSNGNSILPIAINFNPSKAANIAWRNLGSLLNDKSKINITILGYLSLKVGPVKTNNYPINITYTLQDLINFKNKPKNE